MFKRILVPLDGSALAERAVQHAEKFARLFGANIILLRVLEVDATNNHSVMVDPLNWQLRKSEAELYLSQLAAKIQSRLPKPSEGSGKRVEYVLLEGRIAETIINFARANEIDLLVISTHGSSGLSPWNLSSITEKVINQVYLPILLVRAYQPGLQDSSGVFYRRILLPMDSSRRAECVLPAGIILEGEDIPAPAEQFLNEDAETDLPPTSSDTHPHLVFASILKLPELPLPEPYPQDTIQLFEQFKTLSRQTLHRYLDMMVERLCAECEICLVESQNIPAAIHKLVEEKDIDLVIMSAHGATGDFSRPYGSITQDYIDHGNRLVLIIQDVPRSHIQPTAAQVAAKEAGKR